MLILIQTPHPWGGIAQRCHHLARRFAGAGHYVRWVEPRYLAWIRQRPADFWRPRRERPMENLDVRARTLINGERFGFIRAHNKYWLAQSMTSGLPAAAGPEPHSEKRILWLYNPHEAHLARSVPHDALIYDIMDEYAGFPWSPRNIRAEENALLARADWVFAGTSALFGAKREWGGDNIECILSGVDAGHFSPEGPRDPDDEIHRAARSKHRRLAGYAGAVDLRLDQALIEKAAQTHPDWGFVIIGPASCDVSKLEALDNVYLLGQRPYGVLPEYYRSWDAALLPFVENDLTRHINPTKMLEYAGCGRPIIARTLPDVKKFYADGAWLYETSEDFLSHLKTLGGPKPETLPPKLAAASGWILERSWDAIAERMLARVETLLTS